MSGASTMPVSCLYRALKKILNSTKSIPGSPIVKNPPANAGDTGSIPGLGRYHVSNEARAQLLLRLTRLSPSSPREATATRRPCTATREQPPRCNQRKPVHSREDPAQPRKSNPQKETPRPLYQCAVSWPVFPFVSHPSPASLNICPLFYTQG